MLDQIVAESGVPASVREFVTEHIDSVAQLEVLLLLRAQPNKEWTAREVAAALVIEPESVALGWLDHLTRHRLVRAQRNTYRYRPPTELRSTLDDLAESYAKYRVTLVALIFSKPSGEIGRFADTFRFSR